MKNKTIVFFVVVLIIMAIFFFFPKQTRKEEPPKEEPPQELFSSYYKEALSLLENMTLEEKIGQLFLVRFDENEIVLDLKEAPPSGYILFAKDLEKETKESLTTKLATYQQESSIPLIFATDEEGGIVTRVSRFSSFRSERFKSVREYYLEGGIPRLLEIEQEKEALLKELGINLNLAPVADISTNENDYIYNRTLGENSEVVTEYIRQIARYAYQNNYPITLKHFPGYGGNLDTHNGISVDQRTEEELQENSLPPFQAGIEEKVPLIMVSHNIISAYDSNNPASLSKEVHEKLREMGFTGLILTDDLAMEAIQDSLNGEKEAVKAFQAGNDLIMTSSYQTDKQDLKEAVENGTITESEIDETVKRVLAFKYQYQIITKRELNEQPS